MNIRFRLAAVPGYVTTLFVIAASSLSPAASAQDGTTGSLPVRLPALLVEDFHGAFGDHHARAVHAKGIILQGSFKPTAEARDFSIAPVFASSVPITVRFSVFQKSIKTF